MFNILDIEDKKNFYTDFVSEIYKEIVACKTVQDLKDMNTAIVNEQATPEFVDALQKMKPWRTIGLFTDMLTDDVWNDKNIVNGVEKHLFQIVVDEGLTKDLRVEVDSLNSFVMQSMIQEVVSER